ncbi:SipW-dependent-type signal peptide-containing protein [Enterococcus eurekensis]|uniref:SipW-dependent-type signal peptide-containing protein n=1 Tax=Enterococcus eurekensis TaxID=1159753 RepID=A0ABV9M2J4_9ENTE
MLSKDMNNQENQKKQNGNRRYSILLLALLFIGMATYGTYAYFTDSTSVNGNIKLETGTVKFSDITESNWEYQKNGNEKISSTEVEDFDFQNVQPGDSFIKTVQVEYTGTLDGIVTVKQFTNEKLKKGLQYTVLVDGKGIEPNETIRVGKDKSFNVTLEVTIPLLKEVEEKPTAERQNMEFNLDELAEAVTFSVEQTGL